MARPKSETETRTKVRTVKFLPSEDEKIKMFFEGLEDDNGKPYTFSAFVRDAVLGNEIPEILKQKCPKRKLSKCEKEKNEIAYKTANNINQIAHNFNAIMVNKRFNSDEDFDTEVNKIKRQLRDLHQFVIHQLEPKKTTE